MPTSRELDGTVYTVDDWTHGGRADDHDGRDSTRTTVMTLTLRDEPHVSISRRGGDPTRRSLHIGLYDLHNITVYAGDAALEVLRDTITEHLRVVAASPVTDADRAAAAIADAAAVAGAMTGEQIFHTAAAELAHTDGGEAVDQLLLTHIPDERRMCMACTTGGTGTRETPWPCTLYAIAEAARAEG